MTVRSQKIARDLHIVGGGCFGTQYVRWLLRAREKGWLQFRKILAIDLDKNCRLAAEKIFATDLEIVTRDWIDYFSEYLKNSYENAECAEDRWVPSPLSPHILFAGFLRAAQEIKKDLSFVDAAISESVPTPVRIPLKSGDLAVSFAQWQCPVNCIEPATCPAIQQERDWDMKTALTGYFSSQSERRSAHVLQCRHWVHGVGTISMQDIFTEFDRFLENCARSQIEEVVIATTSGCHGLISRAQLHR